jgi:radical SAM superfamily enzyme YgiQ (UPF0313 family)
VLLIGPELEENLGLRSLAASLEAHGIRAELQPFDRVVDLASVRDVCIALRPDVAALSLAFQWRAMDMLALAMALREAGFAGHVTAGGHFATFHWREILDEFAEIDTLCLGEAEETLVDLVGAVVAGRPLKEVRGLALRGGDGAPVETPARGQPALEGLPDPDRRGGAAQCVGHPIATLVAGRGCYASCSFCCIAAWHLRAHEGRRWRLRPAGEVALEMARMYAGGTEIFIFHDDNFLPPGRPAAMARIDELAGELAARGVGRIATVLKARPTDVTTEIFRALQEKLGLVRVFLGIESDAPQGLATLGRGVRSDQNHAAMQVLADQGTYVCFNLLVWDPDTTFEALERNLAFMETHADSPHNFGRVELYAGTPLLARMQAEGRARGDWLGWDYPLATPEVQRAFELSMDCFHERNFGPAGQANRLMGTRFDVEVARHFHPDRFRAEWLDEARRLSRTLLLDSARSLREILAFAQEGRGDAASFTAALRGRMERTDRVVELGATQLEESVQATIGARCRHWREPAPIRSDRWGVAA